MLSICRLLGVSALAGILLVVSSGECAAENREGAVRALVTRSFSPLAELLKGYCRENGRVVWALETTSSFPPLFAAAVKSELRSALGEVCSERLLVTSSERLSARESSSAGSAALTPGVFFGSHLSIESGYAVMRVRLLLSEPKETDLAEVVFFREVRRTRLGTKLRALCAGGSVLPPYFKPSIRSWAVEGLSAVSSVPLALGLRVVLYGEPFVHVGVLKRESVLLCRVHGGQSSCSSQSLSNLPKSLRPSRFPVGDLFYTPTDDGVRVVFTSSDLERVWSRALSSNAGGSGLVPVSGFEPGWFPVSVDASGNLWSAQRAAGRDYFLVPLRSSFQRGGQVFFHTARPFYRAQLVSIHAGPGGLRDGIAFTDLDGSLNFYEGTEMRSPYVTHEDVGSEFLLFDLDDDGVPELVTTSDATPDTLRDSVVLWRWREGGFHRTSVHEMDGTVVDLEAADLDLDGIVEVAILLRSSTGGFSVQIMEPF